MSGACPLVIGSGAVAFRRYRDGSTWRDWCRRAAREALQDAGIDASDVDALVVASESDFFGLQLAPASVVAEAAGIVGRDVVRVEGGGASGALAVREAFMRITAGLAGTVLVVGFDPTASHLSGDDVRTLYALSFDADVEGMAGAGAASLYALSIGLHMARHGTRVEQLARVSVKNHGNAIDNPLAHKPMRLSVDDVLGSDVVSTPYRRLDCSPLSDGAAALVVAHPRRKPRGARASRIAGSGAANDRLRLGDRAEPHRFTAKAAAADAAYAMAGVGDPARDLQLAEVYDAFTGAEIQAVEALGLCADGEGGPAVAEGRFDADAALAVNVSGGLIGAGAAPGATGVMQVLQLHRLLWEPRAADRRRGIADAHGGVCTLSVAHVVERIE